jgi:hypothetical protein
MNLPRFGAMSEAKHGIKRRHATVSMRIDALVVLPTTNPGVLAHSISHSLRDRSPSVNIAASQMASKNLLWQVEGEVLVPLTHRDGMVDNLAVEYLGDAS